MITAPTGLPLPAGISELRVWSVPMRTRFRGIDVRDGVLVRGPAGWGEFSPFWDYDVAESRRWWAAAVRGRRRGLARPGARRPCRSTSPCPPSTPERAHAIVRRLGLPDGEGEGGRAGADAPPTTWPGSRRCATPSGPGGAIRVDANAAWDVDTAVARIARARPRRARVRRAAVRHARGARRAAPPDRRPGGRRRGGPAGRRPAAGRPARGVRRRRPQGAAARRCPGRAPGGRGARPAVRRLLGAGVLRRASRPGVALAAALPELPFACGLATVALFTDDVASAPLLPVDGALPVRRPEPDRLDAVAADPRDRRRAGAPGSPR